MLLKNRQEAGRQLGRRLKQHHWPEVVVLALARGGVPVGEEVARELDAQLEVLVVRKLGSPRDPEVGFGALSEGAGVWIDRELVERMGLSPDQIEREIERERSELIRRVHVYRGDRPLPDLRGKVAVVVDDGLATGSSARAALIAVHEMRPEKMVLAVPVLPVEQLPSLRLEADEVVALHELAAFGAVGAYYADFSAVTDAEVLAALESARQHEHVAVHPVDITSDGAILQGELSVPEGAYGVVILAQGFRPDAPSPSAHFLAHRLQHAGLATLLVDLLNETEAKQDADSGELSADIGLLAERLVAATRWIQAHPETSKLALGYLGASNGAGAALMAAAALPGVVSAVVCCSGRPDMAGEDRLARVLAPTLLVVGSRDETLLAMNREAHRCLRCPSHVTVVADAGRLFDGPGQLEAAADRAARWFQQHLIR